MKPIRLPGRNSHRTSIALCPRVMFPDACVYFRANTHSTLIAQRIEKTQCCEIEIIQK